MPEYDAFISYRRQGGDTLSQLLFTRLTMDGYRVFYDVEMIGPGKFNEQILRGIENSKVIIVVLPSGGLDRCRNENDWVRRELEYAIEKKKTLIPVMMKGFEWPADLPESLKELPHYQGIPAEFNGVFDTWYKKLKSYIPGKPPARKPPEESNFWVKYRKWIIVLAAAVLIAAAGLSTVFYFIPRFHYNQGISLRDEQNWDEAVAEFERAGKFTDAPEQIFETRYRQADALNKAGRKLEAYEIYTGISGYNDADSLAAQLLKSIIVKFGSYPQTAEGRDNTPIEWLVLEYDAENRKALLLSRYGLDVKPYNVRNESVTWENCRLRNWLNSFFLIAAFTQEEESAILKTAVDNSDAGYSGWPGSDEDHRGWTDNGNNTSDKIFLLSCAEANRYFNATVENRNNMASRVEPTAYALSKNAHNKYEFRTEDGGAAGWWWLRTRTPTEKYNCAMYVYQDGRLDGRSVTSGIVCVRPALWINLDSDEYSVFEKGVTPQ